MIDLVDSIDEEIALQIAERSSAVDGQRVNLADGSPTASSVKLVLFVGGYTDGDHGFTVQESTDDGSSWSDVASSDLDGSFSNVSAGGDANQLQEVGYLGTADDIRISTSVSGATDGATYGVIAVQGDKRNAP